MRRHTPSPLFPNALVLVLALLLAVALAAPVNAATSSAPTGAPLANDIRISQVYGGGSNSSATYTHDFIELFNAGVTAVNITGWSVQYASATGNSWTNKIDLTGTINPGQYYLIQGAGGANGIPLPTPDAIASINMGATAGKVALVNTTTVQTGTCPTGAQIIDFVGFGTTANCYEGTGAAPAPSNTTADIRAGAGCIDTDNNAADFTTGAPTPRNSASPLNPCDLAVTLAAFDATLRADGTTRVRWETVSEMDTLGFHLWRSADEGAPAERLTAELIPAQGGGGSQGAAYEWVDASAGGAPFYYWLEDIDTSGTSTMHGPVLAQPDGPTAVTLGALGSGGGASPALPLLALGALAMGAVLLRRRA